MVAQTQIQLVMNIIMKITMKDGISYLVDAGNAIEFFRKGEIIEFYDRKLELCRVDTKDIKFISVIQL